MPTNYLEDPNFIMSSHLWALAVAGLQTSRSEWRWWTLQESWRRSWSEVAAASTANASKVGSAEWTHQRDQTMVKWPSPPSRNTNNSQGQGATWPSSAQCHGCCHSWSSRTRFATPSPHPRTCKWLETPIYKPWNGHLDRDHSVIVGRDYINIIPWKAIYTW